MAKSALYSALGIVIITLALVACGGEETTLQVQTPPAPAIPTDPPAPVPFVPTPTAGEASPPTPAPGEEPVVAVDLYETSGAETIGIGETREGFLPDNTGHNWTFEGAAGQQVTVTLQPGDEGFDVVLRIVGPDGALLEEVDAGLEGEAESVTLTLPVGGLYVARVAPYTFHGGPYTLTVGE